jgi:predicted phosphodiesterase
VPLAANYVRILFITDIHSNLEALEACLGAVAQHDLVVNLGDIVGYGGSPNEVTERSRALCDVFVRGNHDKACTGVTGLEDFNPIAGMAALWTRQTLTPENYDWLRALPQGPVQLENLFATPENAGNGHTVPKVQCVHGSPLDEDEYIIVMRDAYMPLMTTDAAVTFFGHTHIQGGFCVHGEQWDTLRPMYRSKNELEHVSLELRRDGKYLLNPGSVGQPRDGDWRAACALFDSEAYQVTFYRLPYDLEKAQKTILDAKLPDRLALRLADGR